MILSVICRLMCATVPRAHIRFVHSILSLKWSVTHAIVGSERMEPTVLCIALNECNIHDYRIAVWLTSQGAVTASASRHGVVGVVTVLGGGVQLLVNHVR
jgi:hypothetical protein